MKDLDLSKIFGSKCRAKLLERFFLENSSGRWKMFHMRWLSRDIDEQINSVKRELDSLTELWILKNKTELKKKYFFVNPNFDLVEEFTNIFIRMYNPTDKLKDFFKPKDSVELVLLRPSIKNKFIPMQKNIKYKAFQPTNWLDIFIIWDLNREIFTEFLDDIYYGRHIRFSVMSVEEFINRLEYSDKTVKSLLTEKWNIFLKDTMKIKEKLGID